MEELNKEKIRLEKIIAVEGELEKTLNKLTNEKERLSRERVEGLESLEEDRERLKEIERREEEEGERVEKKMEELKAIEEEIAKKEGERRKKEREVEALEKEINKYEVNLAVAKTKFEDLEREKEALKEFEEMEGEMSGLKEQLKKCEEEIEALGQVNTAAIEMYNKRAGEIKEIEDKIESLEEERKAILNMIGEIEERKKEAFFACFDAVNTHFKQLFKNTNLGEGYLYLDKPRTPFESGLYIKIRRGGKEESLESLSGGEKTLVALMFIFALQLYRPSPFYILDEVDAALDKLNSKNFASLIKNLGKGSQFIIVTHNDNVIAETESVIGVSKVDGTSQLVGVLLNRN